MFCPESFQMIASSERKFQPLSLFSQLSKDLLHSFLKKSRFIEEVLFQSENEVVAGPKIEIKWDWVSDVHVHVWRGNLIYNIASKFV